MCKYTFTEIFLVTSALLLSFFVAESNSGCTNSTCPSTTEPKLCENCPGFSVSVVLVSLVICLLPPMTWALVIWWACKSDPTKRRRRQERRRRLQEEARQREEENNFRLSDLPPSYKDASNYPLYKPNSTILTVIHEEGASGRGTAGVRNDTSNDNIDEPPPTYAFVISGSIVSQ